MRVTDYMAVLTVKPLAADQPDQPGIEFSLTGTAVIAIKMVFWAVLRIRTIFDRIRLWKTSGSRSPTLVLGNSKNIFLACPLFAACKFPEFCHKKSATFF
jgi:hypothetical protein